MSTVNDIYSLIQYRPDINVTVDDLIHIVNQAVRSVAKRLYALQSSLIIGKMEVSIFAEVSYTASIAITSTGFTDAASQFVIEGFEKDMPISCTDTTYTGTYRITTAAAETLTVSETLGTVAAASLTITSDDSFGYLPSDFWGLVDKPYISGKKYPLLQLPSVDAYLQYTTGDPIYYQIVGDKIYVTPATGSDYTIMADYYQRPTAITVATATLPWREIFDEVIADYVVNYFRGQSSQSGEFFLEKEIRAGVDLIAAKYDKRAPVIPSGINWNNIE